MIQNRAIYKINHILSVELEVANSHSVKHTQALHSRMSLDRGGGARVKDSWRDRAKYTHAQTEGKNERERELTKHRTNRTNRIGR